jgi:hypothetical protein
MGLEKLAVAVRNRDSCRISYWNLSGNRFEDFEYFSRIIAESKAPIQYINLNGCGISAEAGGQIFRALGGFPERRELKHFCYAGNVLESEEVRDAFIDFLNKSRIETLDLSDYSDEIEPIVRILNQSVLSLRAVRFRHSGYRAVGLEALSAFFRGAKKLREIDISGSRFSDEHIARLIHDLVMNDSLSRLSLHLDELKLNGPSILTLQRGFLEGERFAKWRELSFSGNGMTSKDLRNLLPILSRMTALKSLSFDDTFDRSSVGIGIHLKGLLKIPNLV